jgi:hypothetical protein
MASYRGWRGALVAAAGVFASLAANSQDGSISGQTEDRKMEFHIASQPVTQALMELGRQSGLTIVMSSDLARGSVAPALDGRYTFDEALRRILAATGLHVEYLDKRSVAVLPPKAR